MSFGRTFGLAGSLGSSMLGPRLLALRLAVAHRLAVLPASLDTLALDLDRPRWQVEAALEGMEREGLVIRRTHGFWKLRERTRARRTAARSDTGTNVGAVSQPAVNKAKGTTT